MPRQNFLVGDVVILDQSDRRNLKLRHHFGKKFFVKELYSDMIKVQNVNEPNGREIKWFKWRFNPRQPSTFILEI